jgi:hypothetical protein
LPEIKTKEIDYISVEIINETIDEKKGNIGTQEEKKPLDAIKQKPIKKIEQVEKIKFKPQPPKQKPSIKKENIEPKKLALKPQPPQKKPTFKPKINEIKKEIDNTTNDDVVFDNMLKNIAKYEEQPIKPENKVINKTIEQTTRSPNEIQRIQNFIVGKIYKQIKENYSLPPAPDLTVLDDITVQLRIFVRQDGTINRTIVNKNSLKRAQADPTYLPYVEAAQRAIKKLGKFSKLPEEEYDLWKIIDISFTPYQT